MDALQALALGIIQGITEWLPISSSGHLVIAQELLGLESEKNLLFDLMVHLGSVLAVIAYFWKEIGRIVTALLTPKERRGAQEDALRTLGLLLLVGTVPIGAVGLLLSDRMEEVFTIEMVGAALIVNALILFPAERFAGKGTRRNARLLDAFIIGCFQAMAVVPGISRSGMALCGGLFRGLEREIAATFAFLLSVPTLIGAFAYGALTLEGYDAEWGSLAIGMASAFITGVASVAYLLKAVRSGKLWVFSIYCAALGAAVILTTL